MKRLAPVLFPITLLFAVAPSASAAKPPHFNTIVVNHFTNASGMNQSQEFIQEFSEGLREGLRKWKISGQVIPEATAVDDAAAANSLVVEGKFTSLDKGAILTNLYMEIDIYRISDHVLVKTITTHDHYVSHGAVKNLGEAVAETISGTVAEALKKVNLAGIPAGPPVPRPTPTAAAPAPYSATAQPAAPVFASIQFSSNPAGAEIVIDGNYAGNTPSLVKLRPGTHSIRITKTGYTPWERSIEPGAGEFRTVSAALEKSGQ
ncbi:MAG: PEGA domain-containing protein [Terracidiphilus sp.]|jgi:hypothetical protein